MKNIIKSALFLLCSVCLFTACEDDNDSNPTLVRPATFKLNTPAYSKAYTDLASTQAMHFTWSQPDYGGFPVAAQYQMQFSLSGNFTTSVAEAEADESGNTKADYVMLDQIYNGCEGDVDPAQLAKGLQQIAQWDESEVPPFTNITARLTADYAGDTIYSNNIQFAVVPYYVELKDAPIEIWWLIGGDICDGSWGGDYGKCVIPLQPIEGIEYDKKTGKGEIRWIGYLAGKGFKLRGSMDDNWATQWGQGNTFGTFVKNDGGSGNITVPEAGYYEVRLNTQSDNLYVTAYSETPKVFSGMAISGTFNEWGDTEMKPCFTYDGAQNHDWYVVQTFAAGDKFKTKEAGSWDYNRGGDPILREDGLYVFGTQGGADIVVPEDGNYMVFFNDITGFIRLIKQ